MMQMWCVVNSALSAHPLPCTERRRVMDYILAICMNNVHCQGEEASLLECCPAEWLGKAQL